MRALLFMLCGLALAAASCYSLNTPTPIPGLVNTIVVQTANAALTGTAAAAPPPTITATPVARCVDAAELVEGTANTTAASVPAGSTFTKTWHFRNTGDCTWRGYAIAFASGDRLGGPDSAPIEDTAPGATADVSMDLTAPASAGSFTGLFELRDSTGEPLEVANGAALSVSIAVAEFATAAPAGSTVVIPPPPADCKYVKSPVYPGQIMDLINKARTSTGLPALAPNAKLAAAAQGHSADMACNNYLDHLGPHKATIHDRVVAAGYTPGFSEEMIYCSGTPQDAFNWWMGDKPHHDVIFDKNVTEFGVGYAYLPHTQCVNYYTVDLAKP